MSLKYTKKKETLYHIFFKKKDFLLLEKVFYLLMISALITLDFQSFY